MPDLGGHEDGGRDLGPVPLPPVQVDEDVGAGRDERGDGGEHADLAAFMTAAPVVMRGWVRRCERARRCRCGRRRRRGRRRRSGSVASARPTTIGHAVLAGEDRQVAESTLPVSATSPARRGMTVARRGSRWPTTSTLPVRGRPCRTLPRCTGPSPTPPPAPMAPSSRPPLRRLRRAGDGEGDAVVVEAEPGRQRPAGGLDALGQVDRGRCGAARPRRARRGAGGGPTRRAAGRPTSTRRRPSSQAARAISSCIHRTRRRRASRAMAAGSGSGASAAAAGERRVDADEGVDGRGLGRCGAGRGPARRGRARRGRRAGRPRPGPGPAPTAPATHR